MPSEIDPSIPDGCDVNLAIVLSRHGARDPTASKTVVYKALIDKIQSFAEDYAKGFEFIRDYQYTLGADQLSWFGEKQLVDSGIAFYERYKSLATDGEPFIRAAGQERVVGSARNFTQGFLNAQGRDEADAIKDILIIPEAEGVNNTLNHGTCPEFEHGAADDVADEKQEVWKEIWVPSITERLNRKMPGANLTLDETIYMMDLCPFDTVSGRGDKMSQFCQLFTAREWEQYDYFMSLDKWYGYGEGNPLGPTQGVGYVNEVISRLTGEPVDDHTTTNSTLDSSPETFPLNRSLYADFSHDNDMSSIYAALGLYAGVGDLDPARREPPQDKGGFSAAWTVPFAAKMYVERMVCGEGEGEGEEMVRVLVNDRVIPLSGCGADSSGRCRLSDFVDSLSFARNGGKWDECFT